MADIRSIAFDAADNSSKNTDRITDKLILLGIPVLCTFGSLTHFIYGWSGKALIAGVFTPVNESVWEHLKMPFWPVLIWWIVSFFASPSRKNIQTGRWLASCTAAILICPVLIIAFYYTYTGALGIEALILDILSMILGIVAAQGAAIYIMKHARITAVHAYISLTILILLAAAFTMFTFVTPQIPLFKDPSTGLFGLGN